LDSYRPLHERRQQALRDWARATAVKEVLERSPAGADRYFFVGRTGIVDGKYAIHPILSFPRARWDSKPALRTTIKDGMTVQPSLQHALVSELLNLAAGALQRQHAPEGLPFVA
jgi:hypothetical protein